MRDKLIELLETAESAVYWDSSDQSFINKIADHLISHGVTFADDNNVGDKKPMTNGDRIRAMSDEDLAIFLECFSSCAICKEAMRLDDNPFMRNEKCDEDCALHIFEWLKQPVDDIRSDGSY